MSEFEERFEAAFTVNKVRADYLNLVKQILYELKAERIKKLVAHLKHKSEASNISVEKEMQYLNDFLGKENVAAILPAPPTDTYYGYLRASDLQDTLRKGEKVEELNEKLYRLVRKGKVSDHLDEWNEYLQELLDHFEARNAGVLFQIAYRYIHEAGCMLEIKRRSG